MKHPKKWTGRILMLMLVFVMACSVNAFAASPKLSKTKLTLNVGQRYTLKLNNYKGKVKWKSSGYVKASVDNLGRVVARKKGSVTISAVTAKKTYKCKITVKQPVTKIALDKTSFKLQAGKSSVLKAKVLPTTANDKRLTFKSSNKKIVTVSSKGTIKAIKAGTAIINVAARDGSGRKAYCRVVVTPKTVQKPSTPSAPTVPSTGKGESAAARKFLAELQKMSDQVKKDYERGIRRYVYGEPENPGDWKKVVQEVREGKVKHGVCSTMARWGLTEAGFITKQQHLYAGPDGRFKFNGKMANDPEFDKKFTVLTVNKTPNQLLKEGNLLPGDICGWGSVYHTNVYAGNGTWYEAGRGLNTIMVNGKYIFTSFGPFKNNWMNSKIVQILRLK